MSGLDLKSLLHLTAEETADLFRKSRGWVYKQSGPGGLLEHAVRRYGGKMTLYFKPELERIISSPPGGRPPRPWSEATRQKHLDKKTARRNNGKIPEKPGEKDATSGGADAQAE